MKHNFMASIFSRHFQDKAFFSTPKVFNICIKNKMVKKISMISNEMKDFSVCANAEKLTTE